MAIAVHIIAAIARLLLRIGDTRDATQNRTPITTAVALVLEVGRLMPTESAVVVKNRFGPIFHRTPDYSAVIRGVVLVHIRLRKPIANRHPTASERTTVCQPSYWSLLITV
jgi:hypothetical protein